jgi:hypothetical protein
VSLVGNRDRGVTVPTRGGRAEETTPNVPIGEEVDRRAAVSVLEESAPLSEHALALADPLFELPGLLGVPLVAGFDDAPFDVDAHYPLIADRSL